MDLPYISLDIHRCALHFLDFEVKMAGSQNARASSASATNAHVTANQKPSESIQISDYHVDGTNFETINNLGRLQPTSSSNTSFGILSRKKLLHATEILAVLVSIICLAAAVIVVSPSLTVAWKLGVKRQLQVIGFSLSIMNQCFRIASPKLFLIIEATIGRSVLQNYNAILRNSALISHTSWLWRTLLLFFIALLLGLSVAYKDF